MSSLSLRQTPWTITRISHNGQGTGLTARGEHLSYHLRERFAPLRRAEGCAMHPNADPARCSVRSKILGSLRSSYPATDPQVNAVADGEAEVVDEPVWTWMEVLGSGSRLAYLALASWRCTVTQRACVHPATTSSCPSDCAYDAVRPVNQDKASLRYCVRIVWTA